MKYLTNEQLESIRDSEEPVAQYLIFLMASELLAARRMRDSMENDGDNYYMFIANEKRVSEYDRAREGRE